MAALAELPLPRLEELSAVNAGIGRAGVQSLCAAPWPHLRQLDLSGNVLGPDEVKLLSEWPGLARVDLLGLSHNRLATPALGTLLAKGWPGRLDSLLLAGNPVGVEGLRMLLACPGSSRAVRVTLHIDDIGVQGVELISTSERPSAFEVAFDRSELDADRVRALLKRPGALRSSTSRRMRSTTKASKRS